MKKNVAVVQEPPMLFCGRCRQWKVTDERDPFLGTPRRVWTCSDCNPRAGDPRAPANVRAVASIFRPVETQADISKAERLGPFRAVVRLGGKRGKNTSRAVLECGHETTVFNAMKRTRCRKCKKGGGA